MTESNKDWRLVLAEQKKERLLWVLDNAQEISKLIRCYDGKPNVEKFPCVYIESFEWDNHNILTINTCHRFLGSSFDFKIHHEDLDDFIQKYLASKEVEREQMETETI